MGTLGTSEEVKTLMHRKQAMFQYRFVGWLLGSLPSPNHTSYLLTVEWLREIIMELFFREEGIFKNKQNIKFFLYGIAISF